MALTGVELDRSYTASLIGSVNQLLEFCRRNPVRVVAALITSLAFSMSGCASRSKVTDLGGGFSLAQPTSAPGDHLYFHGSDLCVVDFVSVAPTGNYAIFVRNRDIFLIASANGNLRPVTDGEFTIPHSVEWHEDENFARVDYGGGRPRSHVPLKWAAEP